MLIQGQERREEKKTKTERQETNDVEIARIERQLKEEEQRSCLEEENELIQIHMSNNKYCNNNSIQWKMRDQ